MKNNRNTPSCEYCPNWGNNVDIRSPTAMLPELPVVEFEFEILGPIVITESEGSKITSLQIEAKFKDFKVSLIFIVLFSKSIISNRHQPSSLIG